MLHKTIEKMKTSEKLTGNWRVQLNVQCPYCENYWNVLENQYIEGLPPIAESAEDLEIPIECPLCKISLYLDSTTY